MARRGVRRSAVQRLKTQDTKCFRQGWQLVSTAGTCKGQQLRDVVYDPMDPDWPPASATGTVTVFGPNPRQPAFAAIITYAKGTITEVKVS